MYAASAASVAEQLGLPGWFVELRHAGTHDQLPSMQLLRSGCTQALGWLNENYWKVQKTYVADTAMEVRNLLLRYKERRKLAGKVKGLNNGDQEAEHVLSEVTTIITVDTYREILIPILASQGLLVPVAKKKRSTQQLELSPALVQLWAPALERFEKTWPDFLDDTFACLVETVHDQASASGAAVEGGEAIVQSLSVTTTLAAWARHICRTYGSKLDIKECVEVCLRRPNKYSLALLVDLRNGSPALKNKLKPLLAFMSAQIETEKSQAFVSDLDYVPEDDAETLELRSRIRSIKGTVIAPLRVSVGSSDPVIDKSSALLQVSNIPEGPELVRAPADKRFAWRKCRQEEWRPVPIGCLPGGVVPSLGLNLQLDDVAYAAAVDVVQHPIFQPVMEPEAEAFEDEMEFSENASAGNADVEPEDVEMADLAEDTPPIPPHIIARVSLL
ncbi:rRNA-processing protein las1 [Rhizophlyctis rosea]|uniref:rRNA-processing protein las1 n=1 Tax=Rhizophlyctis rosea TaxID=64517 RepID=A0AAD5X844_9FUNG|nr:rRNA-processing protein las1 [Rhizophlyctis rosea]